MPTINGKTYTKIVTTGVEIWDISPFDPNGNVVREMTIEVDSTLGVCTLNLPSIASFNYSWNFLIKIVGNTATINPIGIKADNTTPDYIGSQTDIILTNDFDAIQLNILSGNVWYGVETN
jgi:hypothetical protein